MLITLTILKGAMGMCNTNFRLRTMDGEEVTDGYAKILEALVEAAAIEDPGELYEDEYLLDREEA